MMFKGQLNAKTIFNYIIYKLELAVEEKEAKSIGLLVMNHLFNSSYTDIIIEKKLSPQEETLKALEVIISRINTQEPVQYVLGTTEFFGLKFKVTPDVLIPRPETEELVNMVVKENQTSGLKILDVGTGSGCIAISIQKNISASEVYAIDISSGALKVAKENAKTNGVDVKFFQVDVLKEMPSFPGFNIIISNPPYILDKEMILMKNNVTDFEPHNALFVPDNKPLKFYERIIFLARNLLKAGGKLYFEINENFGEEIKDLMETESYSNVELIKDMQNRTRFARGIKL